MSKKLWFEKSLSAINDYRIDDPENKKKRVGVVKSGKTITVTVEGADEEVASEAMEKFFKENM